MFHLPRCVAVDETEGEVLALIREAIELPREEVQKAGKGTGDGSVVRCAESRTPHLREAQA